MITIRFNRLSIYEFFILLIQLISIFFGFGILSAVSFLCYLILLYAHNLKFILKYFYLFFLIVSSIAGIFVIEYLGSGLYLYEIATFAYKADSLSTLIFIETIFIISLRFFDDALEARNEKAEFYPIFSSASILAFKYVLLLIISLMFLKVVRQPFFLLGYDRFAYQRLILSSTEVTLFNMLIWVLPVSLIDFKKHLKSSIALLILFILYSFWTANKFSVFIIFFQLLIIILIGKVNINEVKKMLPRITFVIILLFFIVTIQSIVVNGRNISSTINYFLIRLSQQGQLWWGVFRLDFENESHIGEALLEAKSFFKVGIGELQYDLGMFKVMKLVAPIQLVNSKIAQGSRYAAANPAILYYYFGVPLTLIFRSIYAVLIAKLSKDILTSFRMKDIVTLCISCKFLTVLVRSFSNADFHTIFSLENLILLSVMFFMKTVIYKNVRK